MSKSVTAEIYVQTVVERQLKYPTAKAFRDLSENVINNTDWVSAKPLTNEQLAGFT